MKTSFTITIETDNMVKVYNTDDSSQFTKENEITPEIEATIHRVIQQWIKQYLTEDSLHEAVFNDYIPEAEQIRVDGFDDLSDYGNITITFLENMQKNKHPEILVEVKRLEVNEEVPAPQIPEEVVVEEIPPMEITDEEELDELNEDEEQKESSDDKADEEDGDDEIH